MTGVTSLANINKLEALQNKAIRNMALAKYNSHTTPIYYKHNLLKASDLIASAQALVAYKFRMDLLPPTLNTYFRYSYESGDREQCQSAFNLHVPPTIGQGREIFPIPELIKTWNRLPYHIKCIPKLTTFKRELKESLVDQYSNFECSKTRCYPCKQSNSYE